MDQDRRRELRQARRERRQAEQRTAGAGGETGGRRRLFRASANQGETDNGTGNGGLPTSGAGGGDTPSATNSLVPTPRGANAAMAVAPLAAPATSTRRRVASRRNDAARLTEKMQQKKRRMASKVLPLTEREARIQEQYAPHMREMLQNLTADNSAEDAAAVEAATTPAMLTNQVTGFDKDDLLAERITDTQANFLKLDHGLSEDHAFATQKLHAAVFTHANNFLLLFRDVDRASRLVEAIKSNVQGTKTAISTMSKFTFSAADSGRKTRGSSGGVSVSGPSALSAPPTTSADWLPGAAAVHGRVSLVVQRDRTLTQHASDRGSVEAMLANQLAHAHHEHEDAATALPSRAAASSSTGTDPAASETGSAGSYRVASSAARATTRALNVASLQQWRYAMGAPTDLHAASSAAARARTASPAPGATGTKRGTGAGMGYSALGDSHKDADARSRDIDMFVSVVREQMTQLLSERRHADAAETLHGIADEAVRRGCLPLLLELETDLVRSVMQNLAHVPQAPILHESAQVPLIQLLLQFGRVKAGVRVFLALQTPWIQSELLTLQSRVANPTRVCWIAADYLVRLMQQLLRRQQTLLLPTEEAQKVSASLDEAVAAAAAGGSGDSTATAQTTALDALTERLQRKNKLIPPNSTALLWVRQNLELFATRVLGAQALSYGTGTDGGDPSRIRRAAIMTSESIRILQTISAQGSGATAASLTLQLLTPSLVLLETEFARLTTTRLDNSGRAMVEQLITNALLMYETSAAVYQPSRCDDAVRKSNTKCQWLEDRLSSVLPASAHAWLVQLFLSPATCSLFMKTANGTAEASSPAMPSGTVPASFAKMAMPAPLFPQERYRFVRYANGCSVVHQLLLRSVIGFVCALGGADDVLGSLDGDDAGRGEPTSAATTARSAGQGNHSGGGKTGGTAPTTTESRSATGGKADASSSRRLPPGKTERVKSREGRDKPTGLPAASVPLSTSSSASSSPAADCAALLLSNALILESADATLYRLFVSSLWTLLRQRQSLVAYISADAFNQAQQKLFPRTRRTTPWPLLCDPAQSPAFVLDGMLGLSADVLSTGTWVSYLTRGGAVGHLLGSSQLSFRTRHLAALHSAMPGMVQGWLACTIALGHATEAATGLLPVPCAPTAEEASELVAAAAPASRPSPPGEPAATPSAKPFNSSAAPPPPPPTSGEKVPLKRPFESSSLSLAGVASGGAVAAAATTRWQDNGGGALRRGGATRVVVMRRGSTNTDSTTPTSPAADGTQALPGLRGVHTRPRRLLPEATVRQSKLRAFLMSVLDRQYTTPSTYQVHRALPSLPSLSQRHQEVSAQLQQQQQQQTTSSNDNHTSSPPTAANLRKPLAEISGTMRAAWGVRATLPSYPEFPIGGDFDRKDELYLLHWCAQINLHLLTLFQERLLPSSHLVNARAASAATATLHPSSSSSPSPTQRLAELQGGAPLSRPPAPPIPLPGGVSPQEDSALAGLCGGGGNYPTAVATLQFLVVRVLRDVLCQAETWSVVYDCSTVAQWRQDEAVLRQQLFFFALFARFWSPLFAGGTGARQPPPPSSSIAAAATAGRTARGTSSSDGVLTNKDLPALGNLCASQWSVDGLPALAVLEWLTCGHAVRDMHLARVRRQRLLDLQAQRTATTSGVPDAAMIASAELTEEEVGREVQHNPRLQSAIDTYFDSQRASGGGGGSTGSTQGHGWQRDDTLRPASQADTPLTVQAAVALLVGGAGSYIPDTLLRVLQYFFEEQLAETRAIPAITSEAMRTRVDKAMASVNLLSFMGSNLGGESDEDEEEDDGESISGSASSRSGRSQSSSQASDARGASTVPVTLATLRELLEFYVKPVL